MKTVCGSEFQTDGAENRKTRLEKSVLMNDWSSCGMADERKVRLQARSAMRLWRQFQSPYILKSQSIYHAKSVYAIG